MFIVCNIRYWVYILNTPVIYSMIQCNLSTFLINFLNELSFYRLGSVNSLSEKNNKLINNFNMDILIDET